MAVVPVIDLGGAPDRVAGFIDDACREIGFFQIVGQGLDPEIEGAAWSAAAEFFRLPLGDKLAVRIPPGEAYGYGPFQAERLAASLGDATPPDLKETFSVGPNFGVADLPAAHDPAAAFVFSPNRWPAAIPGMAAVFERHYRQLAGLVERLMALMAIGLGLPGDHFAPHIDRHTSAIRALHYPDIAGQPIEPGQLRAGAHSDYGSLSLLRQDAAPGGLQVRDVGGEWHDVEVVDEAYVVNVGDALERWTNDRWRSTLHRVVVPAAEHAGSSTRRSMAFFHNPNWDAVIECLPTCLEPGEAPHHPPVTAGEHLMNKFRSTQS